MSEGGSADGDQLHNDLIEEYYKLTDIVTAFDQRLLTIKGWGVTLSLFSLGLGFQNDHYGLFLVAALSPHVMFPHVISFIAGTILFLVGVAGGLGPI